LSRIEDTSTPVVFSGEAVHNRMNRRLTLEQQFRSIFGAEPRFYQAPGRVNLIGEHTDYNEGFVLPAAIGLHCWIAASPRTDQRLVIHSDAFAETREVDLSRNDKDMVVAHTWSDYPCGVALYLQRAGFQIRGANLLIDSEIPIGAGLSSSAAVEIATACALLDLSDSPIERIQVARLCQRAENEFVGARCGIMDQFISLHGQRGHALVLDCRSLEYELLPVPQYARLVICNTMVKHQLASSEYNRRRAECEEALRLLSTRISGLHALRDVTMAQLETERSMLPEILWRRAYHVVSENERVLEAAAALRARGVEDFGRRMNESHNSLRDFYQVSCPELDLMVELACQQEGTYGARMTGGGFGGCTINLVDAKHTDNFRLQVASAYEKAMRLNPEIYVCSPDHGAGPVTRDAEFGST
jgi:galactokinase